jgi:2-polyprenyl-3-methyl-5-hydroxy-6-metoxy-1,4-benzoquinol methylase
MTIDERYLQYQYGDADKLRIRIETHARFSERGGSFAEWLLPHIAPEHGLALLDTGAGPGTCHPGLARHGIAIVATDRSPGMLREALAQARTHGYTIDAVLADAQRQPFAGASFDRVMANHMLYHVPDREQALRELRRVLRPGGRAVLATNAADNLARLHELHAAAAKQAGYTAGPRDAQRFTLDDLPLVRSAFPTVHVHTREDAFVFPDAESPLRYYATYMIDNVVDRPGDNAHRQRLLPLMQAALEEIIAREGVFRVPKNAGCFVATA